MWMKTGIFQSNAGLTRCIGNLITLVWMSPVGQSQAPRSELQMETASPPLPTSSGFHPFICTNICAVQWLWSLASQPL